MQVKVIFDSSINFNIGNISDRAVRRMLATIAAGVAAVASLTDAITNVQAIVASIK